MFVFKVSFTIIFCFLIVMISDFRNKNISPLFMQVWLVIMRAGYLVPLLCSMFFVWKLSILTIFDYTALLILICGTLIVTVSKKELGKRHSWVGYAAKDADGFCVLGIYAWIRHPLYLGIMVADIGIAFLIIPNFYLNEQLSITFLIGAFFTFIFLIISSIKETKFLSGKFGKAFDKYAQQVNAFFPFRKFKNNPDGEC